MYPDVIVPLDLATIGTARVAKPNLQFLMHSPALSGADQVRISGDYTLGGSGILVVRLTNAMSRLPLGSSGLYRKVNWA